jgi:ribosomal protein L35AE/L33A
MMLEEARELIGRRVTYRPYPEGAVEEGTITSVGGAYVFVRYGADVASKATNPQDLWLVREGL